MNDWQSDAACRGKHELFYAPTHDHGGVQVGGAFDYAEALALCRQECLVVRECRAWALEKGELNHKGEAVHGVVAGCAPKERKKAGRPTPPVPGKDARGRFVGGVPPECGTLAAYKRHIRLSEKPCTLCQKANAAYLSVRRKKERSERENGPGKGTRSDLLNLSPCGTAAAYKRHLRKGEIPCAACREANALKTALHADGRGA